jgi:3-oxoacyl-[acyl-carrier-protein] synthase II
MQRQVVVTGMGAVTPVGHDVATTWDAALKGSSGVTTITRFDAAGLQLKTQIAAEVKGFDPEAHFGLKASRRLDRFVQFALVAAAEAIQDANLDCAALDPYRAGVLVGSGVGGIGTLMHEARVMDKDGPRRVSPFLIPMMLLDMAAGEIAIRYGLKGPNLAVVSACATGAHAIGEAGEMIRRGSADVVICGGSEAGIDPLAIAGFNRMGALSTRNDDPATACRPFDATRDGFVMGEGAGIVVLEALEHAQRRSAPIRGELIGYGATADATHIAAPAPDAAGAVNAMQIALRQSGLPLDGIGYLNAHGTGTALNDVGETKAIKMVFGEHAKDLPISSTKAVTGHLLGAAGAVEAVISLLALEKQMVPPTINYEHPDPECDLDYVPNTTRSASLTATMSNSFGFGGHNGCLIFRTAADLQ